jgi:hypothetical protein
MNRLKNVIIGLPGTFLSKKKKKFFQRSIPAKKWKYYQKKIKKWAEVLSDTTAPIFWSKNGKIIMQKKKGRKKERKKER